MQRLIDALSAAGELRVIDTPLDIYLEIPHIAYIEVKKKGGGQALLFTKPLDSKKGEIFQTPVLMNIFGSFKRLEIILNQGILESSSMLENFLENKGDFFSKLKSALSLIPLRALKAPSQDVIQSKVDLYKLPILTTWELDAAPFITMGQVYTKSLDGSKKNLGMYRLQVKSKDELLLHWQIHKDAQSFFSEYKKAKAPMPVSIGLGGDALLSFAAQAPLPHGIYELLLYSFVRGKNVRLRKCVTNPLLLPSDLDFVIEGWVDTTQSLEPEGPFGDHTGFYTPIEPYPVMKITAITHKKSPIYPATVVGKPPLEDKYMGYLIERLFLPLLKKNAFGLIDFHMPENGVFHNLLLVKMQASYAGHVEQLASLLWGSGQMSFSKHIIIVDEGAPRLDDYASIVPYILERFSTDRLILTKGVCDALDHATRELGYSGKVALNATSPAEKEPCDLKEALLILRGLFSGEVKVYFEEYKSPIILIAVDKKEAILESIDFSALKGEGSIIVVFVDAAKNDLKNPYMLLWRVVNSIDASYDLKVAKAWLFIDATDKNALDGYARTWPKETDCNTKVLEKLAGLKLIPPLESEIYKKYHIDKSYSHER